MNWPNQTKLDQTKPNITRPNQTKHKKPSTNPQTLGPVNIQTELPVSAVSCKFCRLRSFRSKHAVNSPYSCTYLSKFESQTYPSLGLRLGCAAALSMVLLYVLHPLCLNMSRISNWVVRRSESLSYHISLVVFFSACHCSLMPPKTIVSFKQ